jgi:hypothetical protein
MTVCDKRERGRIWNATDIGHTSVKDRGVMMCATARPSLCEISVDCIKSVFWFRDLLALNETRITSQSRL